MKKLDNSIPIKDTHGKSLIRKGKRVISRLYRVPQLGNRRGVPSLEKSYKSVLDATGGGIVLVHEKNLSVIGKSTN